MRSNIHPPKAVVRCDLPPSFPMSWFLTVPERKRQAIGFLERKYFQPKFLCCRNCRMFGIWKTSGE